MISKSQINILFILIILTWLYQVDTELLYFYLTALPEQVYFDICNPLLFVIIWTDIDDEETPFDKQDIITKIQSGGGVVLDKFDEAAVSDFIMLCCYQYISCILRLFDLQF